MAVYTLRVRRVPVRVRLVDAVHGTESPDK
jgi:hypothetical protein